MKTGALISYTWRRESVISKKAQLSADQKGITTPTSKNESVNEEKGNKQMSTISICILFQLSSHYKPDTLHARKTSFLLRKMSNTEETNSGINLTRPH